MPSSLEKTRKHISKKRNGVMDSMHQNSRDSQRLHAAQVRDERLERLATARRKKDRPLMERVSFFQDYVKENGSCAVSPETIQSKINEFVHQYDEEYEAVKKTRRAGRPASAREDLLRMRIASLVKEQQNGFYMPDLSSDKNVALLDQYEGSWSYLTSIAWVRFANGSSKPASFPPK